MRPSPARLIEPESAGGGAFEALLARAAEPEMTEGLRETGALLLRGFAVDTVDQFAALVERLAGAEGLTEYRGGASPRSELAAGRAVYNSTEYPAHIELPLHNELSYTACPPARVYFLCLEPAAVGGETTLADSRRILEAIPSDVRGRFEEKGVRYIRNLPPGAGTGYSWEDAFGSDDPAEVEARCEAMGAACEWIGGGYLRVTQDRSATARHPVTGEAVWFNQADGFHPSALDSESYAEQLASCGHEDRFRLGVRYGDGSPIEPESLAAVRDALRREAYPHAWQRGDVLVLDNYLVAHGRRPFEGTRLIAAAMS